MNSTSETKQPRDGIRDTRHSFSSDRSASRTGVRETPKRTASSSSTNGSFGNSRNDKISDRRRSHTKSVADDVGFRLYTDTIQRFCSILAGNCQVPVLTLTRLLTSGSSSQQSRPAGHIARLRASRGLKTTATGQRFLDGFGAMHALRRGDVALRWLVLGYRPKLPVAAAMATLATGLIKAALMSPTAVIGPQFASAPRSGAHGGLRSTLMGSTLDTNLKLKYSRYLIADR